MANKSAWLFGCALFSTPLAAQQAQAPSPYTRAVAAGYKAAITCSAMFLGGRTQEQIADSELRGVYGEYDAIIPQLKAEVSGAAVTVAFDKDLPARVAMWRQGKGCVTLPIGAPLPAATAKPDPVAGPSPAPFPQGDATPRVALPPIAAVTRAFETPGYGGRTTAVVVLNGPRIVAEHYAEGFGPFVAQRTWSVAKSVTGTFVGIAAAQGAINVEAPAPIAAWRAAGDPRGAIRLDNLLRMASGLHSDTAGNRTDAIYFGGTTVSENAPAWPLEARPGTRFRYANNDILLTMLSLREALGEERYRNYPNSALFARIGMAHSVIETDWQGNFIGSSQMWTTARDLARFGLLYLNDGVWNGTRILPAGWRDYVTRASGPQPAGGFGYGATFWLLNKVPGVPADTFAAIGNRGQYVVIIPSRNIVIVRRGEDPGGGGFDIAHFVADILAQVQ